MSRETIRPICHCAAMKIAELRPPTIRETFTLLPCSGAPAKRTTLELEGCAEHQIIKRDRGIDALNRTIFTRLGDDGARRRFIAGHDAWLAYRHAYCLSRSDTAEGGTLAGVIDADCTAQISAQHLVDLRAFLLGLGGK
jgi:uncharacterized protein YecT (DUF1311 family)